MKQYLPMLEECEGCIEDSYGQYGTSPPEKELSELKELIKLIKGE